MQVKTGTGNKGLDWIIIAGMIAAYPKTADLLSLFSPQILNDIVGFDVSLPYGLFCAAMVEGTILFLHFDRRAHVVTNAQIVKWLLIFISFLCQVFDGYVTTDQVSQMSDSLKLVLTFGIPTLPLIIAVMVASIGALPEYNQEQKIVRQPRVGLKTRLENIWLGENTRVSPKIVEQIEEILNEPEQEEQSVNPTNGKRR
jgi:hypothetical protein